MLHRQVLEFLRLESSYVPRKETGALRFWCSSQFLASWMGLDPKPLYLHSTDSTLFWPIGAHLQQFYQLLGGQVHSLRNAIEAVQIGQPQIESQHCR